MALPHNSDRPPRPAVAWVVLPGVKRRLLDGLGGCGAAQNEQRSEPYIPSAGCPLDPLSVKQDRLKPVLPIRIGVWNKYYPARLRL
jgi:hypothetical protein